MTLGMNQYLCCPDWGGRLTGKRYFLMKCDEWYQFLMTTLMQASIKLSKHGGHCSGTLPVNSHFTNELKFLLGFLAFALCSPPWLSFFHCVPIAGQAREMWFHGRCIHRVSVRLLTKCSSFCNFIKRTPRRQRRRIFPSLLFPLFHPYHEKVCCFQTFLL